MEEVNWFEKWPKAVRWIIWLPAPFILSRLVFFLVQFCSRWAGVNLLANPDSFIYMLCDSILTTAFIGYCSYAIAPKWRYGLGISQPIIWCVLCIVLHSAGSAVVIERYGVESIWTWQWIRLLIAILASIITTVVVCINLFRYNKDEKEAEAKLRAETEELTVMANRIAALHGHADFNSLEKMTASQRGFAIIKHKTMKGRLDYFAGQLKYPSFKVLYDEVVAQKNAQGGSGEASNA